MEAMRGVCRQRFEEFGAAGQAHKIKPLPMSAMAKRYAGGELSPTFGAAARAAA